MVTRAVCLALLAVGCGAPAPGYRPAFVDPSLGGAPDEALSAWHVATWGRYPERNISFIIDPGLDAIARTAAPSDESRPVTIRIRPGITGDYLRRTLLHELGHAIRLLPDPESSDAVHWHGAAPSVMRPLIEDCADSIGAPELAAFDRKFGR